MVVYDQFVDGAVSRSRSAILPLTAQDTAFTSIACMHSDGKQQSSLQVSVTSSYLAPIVLSPQTF